MRVQCSQCRTVLKIDESRIPAKGAVAKCPKCQARVMVRKPPPQHAPEEPAAKEAPPPEPETPPQQPQAPPPSPEESEPPFPTPEEMAEDETEETGKKKGRRKAGKKKKAPRTKKAAKPKDSSGAAVRPGGSMQSERFRTIFLVFYSLSSLIPILILLYIFIIHIMPHVPPSESTTLEPITYALLAMMGIPMLGVLLMNKWVKGLEDLSRKVQNMTAEVLEDRLQVTEKNELIAVEKHLDGLYEELQSKVEALNEQSRALMESKKRLAELSLDDETTGLFTRRSFEQRLAEETARSDRSKRALSLVMMQADGYRRLKDARGPEEADRLLGALGGLIVDYIDKTDMGFRYDEDEFAILMPERGMEEAAGAAQKILDAASLVATADGDGAVLACGIASYIPGSKNFASEVDRTLEAAKSAAKGKVVFLPPKKA